MKKFPETLTPLVAAVLIIISVAILHIANADSFSSSPILAHAKQDAMNATITDGLRLANQSYRQWQEKQEGNQSDQQEQLSANGLNSHSNNKFDNHSPSVMAQLPF